MLSLLFPEAVWAGRKLPELNSPVLATCSIQLPVGGEANRPNGTVVSFVRFYISISMLQVVSQ
jgi:hypothetical protein